MPYFQKDDKEAMITKMGVCVCVCNWFVEQEGI